MDPNKFSWISIFITPWNKIKLSKHFSLKKKYIIYFLFVIIVIVIVSTKVIDLVTTRRVGGIDECGEVHLHLANPNRSDQLLRQLILRLRLHHKPHIDGDARHVPQSESQNGVRDGTASNVNINLKVIRSSMIVTRKRFPQ